MLAKIANDNAGILNVRGVWKCFASKLAPTGIEVSARTETKTRVKRQTFVALTQIDSRRNTHDPSNPFRW